MGKKSLILIIAVSEVEERAKRSSNLMLFNLKESGESADEIKRDDGTKLKETARIMDTSFEALKAIRIGKKETGKTRPLKVIFRFLNPRRKECCSLQGKNPPYQQ